MNVEQAAPWMAKATEDLDVARRLDATGEVHPSYACFLSQQTAEKALKALLAARGLAIPRTHDLNRLLALLTELGSDLDADAGLLTPYAVTSRYPDEDAAFAPESGTEAIVSATRILRAVHSALGLVDAEPADG